MKSEFSGIFQVKQAAKTMVLGSLGTYFMHTRINKKLKTSKS